MVVRCEGSEDTADVTDKLRLVTELKELRVSRKGGGGSTGGSTDGGTAGGTAGPLTILAGCNSLAPGVAAGAAVGALVGDPLEKACFAETGYSFGGRNSIYRRCKACSREEECDEGDECTVINIIHRYAFESRLKRMSVIVSIQCVTSSTPSTPNTPTPLTLLSKGAPEQMRHLLNPCTIPLTYEREYMSQMAKGRRVLTLASKKLGNMRLGASFSPMREDVERGLEFQGFIVLDCPLKPDTRLVVRELRDAGSDVKMITGDSGLTAREVGRRVGILNSGGGVRGGGGSGKRRRKKEGKALKQGGGEGTLELKVVDGKMVWEAMGVDAEEEGEEEGGGRNHPTQYEHVVGDEGAVKGLVRDGWELLVSGDSLMIVCRKLLAGKTDRATSGDDEKDSSPASFLASGAAVAGLVYLVPHVKVFARQDPKQKELVIACLNGAGFTSLMCGDGT